MPSILDILKGVGIPPKEEQINNEAEPAETSMTAFSTQSQSSSELNRKNQPVALTPDVLEKKALKDFMRSLGGVGGLLEAAKSHLESLKNITEHASEVINEALGSLADKLDVLIESPELEELVKNNAKLKELYYQHYEEYAQKHGLKNTKISEMQKNSEKEQKAEEDHKRAMQPHR